MRSIRIAITLLILLSGLGYAAPPTKYSAQQVLNKVFVEDNGNLSFGNKYSEQNILNLVLDEDRNCLRASLGRDIALSTITFSDGTILISTSSLGGGITSESDPVFTASGVQVATGTLRTDLTAVALSTGALVKKSGDTMTGNLTTTSSITVNGGEFSVGESTFIIRNGGVGIGTNPVTGIDLVIKNTGNTQLNMDCGANSASTIMWQTNGVNTFAMQKTAEKDWGIYDYTAPAGYRFWLKTVSGNIGISTNTPTYKLDVNGDAIVRSSFTTTGNIYSGGNIYLGVNSLYFGTNWVIYQNASPSGFKINDNFSLIDGKELRFNTAGTKSLKWGTTSFIFNDNVISTGSLTVMGKTFVSTITFTDGTILTSTSTLGGGGADPSTLLNSTNTWTADQNVKQLAFPDGTILYSTATLGGGGGGGWVGTAGSDLDMSSFSIKTFASLSSINNATTLDDYMLQIKGEYPKLILLDNDDGLAFKNANGIFSFIVNDTVMEFYKPEGGEPPNIYLDSVTGNIITTGTVTAQAYLEGSDIFTGDALGQIKKIKAEKNTGDWSPVDHNSLPAGVRYEKKSKIKEYKDKKTGKITRQKPLKKDLPNYTVTEKEETFVGRNLGNQVEFNLQAIRQLLDKVDMLENRVKYLENK